MYMQGKMPHCSFSSPKTSWQQVQAGQLVSQTPGDDPEQDQVLVHQTLAVPRLEISSQIPDMPGITSTCQLVFEDYEEKLSKVFRLTEAEQHVRSCGVGEPQPTASLPIRDAETHRVGRELIGLSLNLGKGF